MIMKGKKKIRKERRKGGRNEGRERERKEKMKEGRKEKKMKERVSTYFLVGTHVLFLPILLIFLRTKINTYSITIKQ